jgi:hypothetical protein
MRRGLAIVAGVLLGASACMAAGYYRQMLMLPRAAGGTAPATLTASVLLHFDEASGSTNIVDSGKNSLSVASFTGAQTTNSPAKFGNAASLEGVTARRFSVGYNSEWGAPGTNNWSVDCWLNLVGAEAATNSLRRLLGDAGTPNLPFVSLSKTATKRWECTISTNGSAFPTASWNYDVDAVSNTWMHVAIWKRSGYLYAATNGSIVAWLAGSTTNLTTYNFASTSTASYVIGATSGRVPGSYVDEFRICVGAAMPYGTTNFTPPTAAYTGYE